MHIYPFYNQLATLAREHPTATKWVILPLNVSGWAMAERLVHQGTNWLNFRFQAVRDLALRTAAPFLVERGVDPAPDGLGPALLLKLLLDQPLSSDGYLRPLAGQHGLAEALWRSLTELRMAGLKSADLTETAFANPNKARELRVLLKSYEDYLLRERLTDQAGLIEEALAHPEHLPIGTEDLVLEYPDVAWSALERQLLDNLSGQRLRPEALTLPGIPRPRRLKETPQGVLPTGTSDAARLAWLAIPTEAPPALGDGTLELLSAGGRDAELEEIFRRILERQLPIDSVEIVSSRQEFLPSLWEKAYRHGFPCTVGRGLPALMTKGGRALQSFVNWVEGGLAAIDLRQLLLSGDVILPKSAVVSASHGAHYLASAGARWGRATYSRVLLADAERLEDFSRDLLRPEEQRLRLAARAGGIRAFASWLEEFLALVPAAETFPFGEWLRACRYVLEELVGEPGGPVLLGLEDLTHLASLPITVSEAARMVRDRLQTLRWERSRARPGHLHLSLMREAGQAGRPYVFVMGLEEGAIFPTATEDPLLLDQERERLTGELRLSADLLEEGYFQSLASLASLGEHVTFSLSCCDLRENRATSPSWLMLHAARLLHPGLRTYDELLELLGDPASLCASPPERAASVNSWWLSRARGPHSLPAVMAAYPHLARGRAAEEARRSSHFTDHDGRVLQAAGHMDPRQHGRAISATSLEELAACPFRHFLRYGLGLRPLELERPNREGWLDSLDRGSLLHQIYAELWRELREKGERPSFSLHRDRALGLLAGHLARWEQLDPPLSLQGKVEETRQLERDVELWLRLEEQEPERTAAALEVAFGLPGWSEEPLGREDAVELPDLGIRLHGRIDRIDRLEDGTYEVVDYKTGASPEGRPLLDRGRQLQPALYALVAKELLGAPVRGGSYFYPTERARYHRLSCPLPDGDTLADLIEAILEPARTGCFPHAVERGGCRWCPFQTACRDRDGAHARAKKGCPELESLERLAEYA